MLTIAGTGPGPYSLEALARKISLQEFDAIVLDRGYDNDQNRSIVAPIAHCFHFDTFAGCRSILLEKLSQDLNAKILYVVTGSPLFFSGARSVLEHLERQIPGFRRDIHLSLLPAHSSLDALLAATGTDAATTGVLSLHGRTDVDLEELLRKTHTFVLCEASSLVKLAEILTHLDDADTEITVGSRLGYEDERVFTLPLSEIPTVKKDDLERWMPYSLLVRRCFETDTLPLNDDDFVSEGGMITKTEKRRLALQSLELRPGLLFWDVGAGSGSVAIEAFLRSRVRTVLFEQNARRALDIRANLKRHRVCSARLVEGDALFRTLEETEDPDRIFVGGGGSQMVSQLPALYGRLKPGGILLCHYVVLNHLAEAVMALEKALIPFRVQSISLTNYREGSLMFSETERLLFLVQCRKPREGHLENP